MASQFFWLIATLDIVASLGIEVWIRTGRTGALKTERFAALVRGQRQDAWLMCAVVWTVVLSDFLQLQWLVYVAGAWALLWLLRRTAQRLLLMGGRQ